MPRPGATDPADLDLLEVAALLRSRELSAVELLDACLTRIAERNGGEPSFDGAPQAVNAWVRLYPEIAREHARAADERLTGGERLADPVSLCGIPLALKDVFAVRGLPLTASSRVLEGNIAGRWRRVAAAGRARRGAGRPHAHA